MKKRVDPFENQVFLLDYEYYAYVRNVPARWIKDVEIVARGKCEYCGEGEQAGVSWEIAHRIGFVNGIVRFSLTPWFLNQKSNLALAHKGSCNDALELNDEQTVERLKTFYGEKDLPSHVPLYIRNLWNGVKMDDVFFPPPPSSVIPYDTGFDGRQLLTKEEFLTYSKKTPNHGPITVPKKELCEVCNLPGDGYSPLQNAHVIGFAPGIKKLGLTPDFLNSAVNLKTAHRTRVDNNKCNKKCELKLRESMIFLKSIGFVDIGDYLPAETLALWKAV